MDFCGWFRISAGKYTVKTPEKSYGSILLFSISRYVVDIAADQRHSVVENDKFHYNISGKIGHYFL